MGTKNKESGLLRALGANKGDLRQMIFQEALVLVIMGNLLGYFFTYIWYHILLNYLFQQQIFPFVTPPLTFVTAAGGGIFVFYILIALTASWYPMYKSSKLELSAAMEKGDID